MLSSSTAYARISTALLLSACCVAGSKANSTESAELPRGESTHLRINVQAELDRMGLGFVLVPLPTSTASHIYARPLWITNRRDDLWCQLANQHAWHRDSGLMHRLGHRGSKIGFRQKRSPSLHISVYDDADAYIYEFHFDRFLSIGHAPVSAVQHIFGEVIPNRYFGKSTSQAHIGVLLQRRQLLEQKRVYDHRVD
jgi:hypothetical protein